MRYSVLPQACYEVPLLQTIDTQRSKISKKNKKTKLNRKAIVSYSSLLTQNYRAPRTPQLDTNNYTLKTNTHPAPRNSHLPFVRVEGFAEIAHQDDYQNDANEQNVDVETLVDGVIQNYLIAIFRKDVRYSFRSNSA